MKRVVWKPVYVMVIQVYRWSRLLWYHRCGLYLPRCVCLQSQAIALRVTSNVASPIMITRHSWWLSRCSFGPLRHLEVPWENLFWTHYYKAFRDDALMARQSNVTCRRSEAEYASKPTEECCRFSVWDVPRHLKSISTPLCHNLTHTISYKLSNMQTSKTSYCLKS